MAQNQVNFPLKSLLCILIWTSTLTKASGKQREFLFGKCELYAGSTCKEFLQGKRIYMKNYLSQNVLERRIATWLQTAKRTKSISNSCWPHARVLICYHTFPVCEGAGSSLRSRPFCQDECKYLETSVCRKEFLLAKSIAAIRHYVPSCSNLPRPGTPQYANCWRLPSLDKSKYPRGISVAYRRNFTVMDTERASLKCYFNLYNLGQRTQKPIRMTWYKYDGNVLKRGGKYRMKRRKRGEFRIISTLIIKSATMSDSGLYHCVAKQGEKSVKSEVYLTVTKRKLSKAKEKVVKDGRKSQGPKSTLRKTPEKYSFGNGLGQCAPYRGTACAKYLKQGKNSYVFEYSYSPQTLVEKRLIREFRRIKEAGVFSTKCEEIGLAIMCYNVFNACNKSSNTPVSRLCQDDCYLFDKVLCKYEVELASKHSSAFEFLPDCSLLPNKNPLCEPVAIPQMRLWTAGNDTQCYNGTGKDYKGIANFSKTGRRCKPWKEFSPVYKFSHNFCRNYGGENYAPWCYVRDGVKEFCAVQRCSGQDMDAALDSSAIPVIPTDTGCYIGKGENYQGLVKSSKSDRLCLRWSMMGSYTARHNYCRNYGGKRDAPWCFVSRTEKEYCNIPKCDQNAQPVTSDNNPPSLVYYVIPVAIALSVLLLVVLVLLVYLKHRKKANADTRPPSQTKETSRPVNTIRIDKDEIIGPPIPEQMDKASSDNESARS